MDDNTQKNLIELWRHYLYSLIGHIVYTIPKIKR